MMVMMESAPVDNDKDDVSDECAVGEIVPSAPVVSVRPGHDD